MSTPTGAVVDIALNPGDLKMTMEDFGPRVLEPALARLRAHFVADPTAVYHHMRITLRSVSQQEFDSIEPSE